MIVFDRPTREGRPLISVTLRPSIPSLHSFIVFSGWCKLQYTTLNLLWLYFLCPHQHAWFLKEGVMSVFCLLFRTVSDKQGRCHAKVKAGCWSQRGCPTRPLNEFLHSSIVNTVGFQDSGTIHHLARVCIRLRAAAPGTSFHFCQACVATSVWWRSETELRSQKVFLPSKSYSLSTY